MIRMVVVDDHLQTRAQVIQMLSSDLLKVVGEAETSDETLRVSEKLLPDIVLLDLHLPGFISSLDLVKRLNQLRNVKVVAFADQSKAADIQSFLEAGAYGYLLKDDPPELIKMALLMVSRGKRQVLSPSLPRQVTMLSPQERTMLREITQRGKLAKAATRLGIAEATLVESATELAEKLNLKDAEALIRWAKKQGF